MAARFVSVFKVARSAGFLAAFAVAVIGGTRAAQAAETYSVTYRCVKWKTVHFEQAEKAKLHHDTVKKLGCEAKQDGHDGHFDVTYRCEKWKEISLKDHDAVHRWEKWLKASGFETKHAH